MDFPIQQNLKKLASSLHRWAQDLIIPTVTWWFADKGSVALFSIMDLLCGPWMVGHFPARPENRAWVYWLRLDPIDILLHCHQAGQCIHDGRPDHSIHNVFGTGTLELKILSKFAPIAASLKASRIDRRHGPAIHRAALRSHSHAQEFPQGFDFPKWQFCQVT